MSGSAWPNAMPWWRGAWTRGGGRKKTGATDPTVGADLEGLVAPATRGDPASPLRWTSKSVRKLAALQAAGHPDRRPPRRRVVERV
jgi:hypothetical protein